MGKFLGQLHSHEIFSAIYNMIISQQVFVDNLGKHQTLVDEGRVDGSLFGDTKLYYSTDVLKSSEWGNDAEAANLLKLYRPKAPNVQEIVLNKFRQICLTVDNYLTKRAWSTEGAFNEFNSTMLGWIRDTKKIYDGTTYNVFIGTTESTIGEQSQSVDLATTSGHPLNNLSGVEKEQMEAMLIAQKIADIMLAMGDYSRDFNDYGNLRSYADEDIKIIWNGKYINKIRKIDLPTIFHKDGLIDKFEERNLNPRYFGTVITSNNKSSYSAATPAAGKPINNSNDTYVPGNNHANGCIRSIIEKEVTVSDTSYHVFPGDEIPAGATIKTGGNFELGEVYIEEDDIICKILVKLPPYMSAFEVATSFFNSKSLTETNYLTFGHNTLEYLKNYPFITVKASK